ncbi:MAG TPA: suppressor of fused domain protein [Solirubrobacteraceae bacterium]|nr:suppressor of fused domain protein [Solirubrobacteraceae bacterium]
MAATAARKALRAHLTGFFGEHTIAEREWTLGPIRTRVPDFVVYEIGPGPRLRGCWTYVTSGCWAATARDGHGLEFVLSATNASVRHIECLAMTAYYHAGPEEQRLDWGLTVPIGEPWTAGSLCTYDLISLPYVYGPDLEICRWECGHIRILATMPITEAERNFKVTHGIEALEQRFDQAKIAFADPHRPSVID